MKVKNVFFDKVKSLFEDLFFCWKDPEEGFIYSSASRSGVGWFLTLYPEEVQVILEINGFEISRTDIGEKDFIGLCKNCDIKATSLYDMTSHDLSSILSYIHYESVKLTNEKCCATCKHSIFSKGSLGCTFPAVCQTESGDKFGYRPKLI